MRKVFLITVILLFAGFLRFYKISDVPPALNWDEVSHGYNAYSLLQIGKDQWGKSFPLFNFRAYGDYPMVLNMYLTIPAVKLLGLNEFSVRLPSMILGTLIVLLTFFLAQIFFKDYRYSLLAMFIATVSPWFILPSRAVFQSTVAQFFVIGGVITFFQAIQKKRTAFLFVSLLLLALSQFGYHNTRIFVPPFFISLLVIFRKELKEIFKSSKFVFIFSFAVFLVLTSFQIFNLLSSESRARGQWVFLVDQGAINYINQQRSTFISNPEVGRILYNKATYFIAGFSGNYLNYFNPQRLFFTGGSNYQFSVPGWGVLYPVFLPFFYLGLFFLITNSLKKDKQSLLLFSWLILGLFPAAITKDGFQVIRAVSILPIPIILILIGIKKTFKFLEYRFKRSGDVLIFLVVLISLVSTVGYMKTLFGEYAKNYSWSWQYGYKEAVSYIKENYSKYDQIIFTKKYGEPHEYILFWWPWNPSSYLVDSNKKWDYHTNWYWVDSFDKFSFVNDWEIKDKLKIKNPLQGKEKLKILLVTSPGNYSNGWQLLKTINFLDAKPAFDILTN